MIADCCKSEVLAHHTRVIRDGKVYHMHSRDCGEKSNGMTLRSLREGAGLSLRDLAGRLNMSVSVVHAREQKGAPQTYLNQVKEITKMTTLSQKRVEAGLTIATLAKQLGVSQSMIWRVENGAKDVSPKTRARVIQAYNSLDGDFKVVTAKAVELPSPRPTKTPITTGNISFAPPTNINHNGQFLSTEADGIGSFSIPDGLYLLELGAQGMKLSPLGKAYDPRSQEIMNLKAEIQELKKESEALAAFRTLAQSIKS